MGVGHLQLGRCAIDTGPTAWNSLSDDLRDPMLNTDKTRLFSEY